MLLIARMPSEYSVAGSQPSTITGAEVSYVNTWLLDCCWPAGGDEPPQAASSTSSAEPDASSPARWGFMPSSVRLLWLGYCHPGRYGPAGPAWRSRLAAGGWTGGSGRPPRAPAAFARIRIAG